MSEKYIIFVLLIIFAILCSIGAKVGGYTDKTFLDYVKWQYNYLKRNDKADNLHARSNKQIAEIMKKGNKNSKARLVSAFMKRVEKKDENKILEVLAGKYDNEIISQFTFIDQHRSAEFGTPPPLIIKIGNLMLGGNNYLYKYKDLNKIAIIGDPVELKTKMEFFNYAQTMIHIMSYDNIDIESGYDAIFLLDCIRFVANKELFLKQILDKLRPGCGIILSDVFAISNEDKLIADVCRTLDYRQMGFDAILPDTFYLDEEILKDLCAKLNLQIVHKSLSRRFIPKEDITEERHFIYYIRKPI